MEVSFLLNQLTTIRKLNKGEKFVSPIAKPELHRL